MFWLMAYMRENELSPEEIARRASEYRVLNREEIFGQPTGALVATLAAAGGTMKTCATFASAIAAVCGATGRQRDMLVTARHRREWRFTDEAVARAQRAAARVEAHMHPWRALPAVTRPRNSEGGHAVVKIDKHANVFKRYSTIEHASEAELVSASYIIRRCMRQVKSEFDRGYYSYRYADEWDKMDQMGRLRDVGAAGHPARPTHRGRQNSGNERQP